MKFGFAVKSKRSSQRAASRRALVWESSRARNAAMKHPTLYGAQENGDDMYFYSPSDEEGYRITSVLQLRDAAGELGNESTDFEDVEDIGSLSSFASLIESIGGILRIWVLEVPVRIQQRMHLSKFSWLKKIVLLIFFPI